MLSVTQTTFSKKVYDTPRYDIHDLWQENMKMDALVFDEI